MSLHLKDRLEGCLVGGALGDAMGEAFEGTAGEQLDLDGDEIPWRLWVSDDTQLTLATCEAILERSVVDPETVAGRFLVWFRGRRLSGLGSSTLKALRDLDAGAHWALSGASGERSAGNGAAMRIAPLAFFLDPDVESDRRVIRDVCRITHHNDEAYLGALALVRVLRHVLDGHLLDAKLWNDLIEALPDSRIRDRLISIREVAPSLESCAATFGKSGYVVDSVPLALLAAVHSTDFLTTIRQLVRVGGDVDTIASMFGNLYGAAHGVERLPLEIVDRIDLGWEVRRLAGELAPLLESRP